MTLTASTITGNTAGGSGGGIDNAGTANLGATIVAESTSGGDCSGPITDEGYNMADDASCGFSATGRRNSSPTLDADLGPLQNNGGPTDTMALLAGSPAIDQVTSGSACARPPTSAVPRGRPPVTSVPTTPTGVRPWPSTSRERRPSGDLPP